MTQDERLRLGSVGVWTFGIPRQPAGAAREAAAEIEELGYGAIWFGEAFGRDALSQAAQVLGATRRIVAATGIANIYLRSALAMAAAERSLAEEFPGRFLLGLGGHRVSTQPQVPGFEALGKLLNPQERALPAMRAYLDAMDTAPLQGAAPAAPPRRVLAALGPRMLELAAERTWGAHPYHVPVEHTARARQTLGPAAFLGVEQAVVLDRAATRARDSDTARAFIAGYGAALHQTNNLRRLGFGDDDFAGGGSDRLLEALVAVGDEAVIAKRVREHLDAGADHVCIQVLTGDEGALPLREWRELAPALL